MVRLSDDRIREAEAMRDHSTVWVCVDCLMAHHGISADERGEDYPEGTLALLAGEDVSAGMMADEHSDDCPVFNGPSVERDFGAECDCEQVTFSSAPCEGCGSQLAGSRDALTVFWKQGPRMFSRPDYALGRAWR